jgi:hypothetical protein
MELLDGLKSFLGGGTATPSRQSPLGSIPPNASKESLIRALVKKRTNEQRLRVTNEQIDDLPVEVLMALPEATVFTIIEVFSGFRLRGYSVQDAADAVNAMREPAGKAYLPQEASLAALLRARLEVEHAGDQMTTDHVNEVCRQAFLYCSQGQ